MVRPDDHVVDYVDDFLHGALTEADAEHVERHCEGCAICQTALAEAQRRYDLLLTAAPSEASGKLITDTIERLSAVSDWRRKLYLGSKRTLLLATAAAILAIASFQIYYARLAPTPYDLRLLGQKNWITGSTAAMRVAVYNQRTGLPVAGAETKLTLVDRGRGEHVLAEFTTDGEGRVAPKFQVPAWNAGTYQLLVSSKIDGVEEKIVRNIKLFRSWRLMVSTDKPLYQPGQTIHLRALALQRPQLKPLAGRPTEFRIWDARNNLIFKQSDVTSQFGIASADCPLASQLNAGLYRIECQVDDTKSTRTVKVESYSLPKFRVQTKLNKSFYRPGDQAEGTISASYFYGKPVAGQLELSVEQVAGAFVDFDVIHKTNLELNDEGQAEFRFEVPQNYLVRSPRDTNGRIRVAARITDTAGQVVGGETFTVITREPIRVEVIPESATLAPGRANRIFVFASYADGRPAANVRVIASNQAQELRTDALGMADFEVEPDGEQLDLQIKAIDDDGMLGRRQVSLGVGVVPNDFVLRPSAAVLSGGETLGLSVFGGGVEPVFVDVVRDRQTILATVVNLQDGVGHTELDLPPEMFGTLTLVAYRFDPASGLPVRKSRIIYVRQPKELNLNATLDRESYRPGEKAVVKFRVTDPDGAASPGAISVAMVDEAVFHAGSTSGEVMEHVFFLLENELLEPVFQLYDWSPAATWGETPFVARRRFEQALFARTASASFGRNAETWRGSRRAQRVDRMQGVRLSSSPHSNVETSYPAKRRQVARDRRDGLKSSQVAWSSLLGCWILIGMGVFAYRFPRISLAIVGASCAGSMVIAPLLFLLQKADIMPTSGARDAMAAGGEMPTAMPTEDPFAEPSDSVGGKAAEPLRVREFFPETLVWRPELVTNEQGEAELEVDLADSITSWRLSASAVTEQGNLGASRLDVPVFQPFFVDTDLPIALTRDDEIAVPIVVYNYLDTPQEVQLTLKADSWFELLEDSNERSVALQPGEVRSTSMRIRALEVGRHSFEIAARGQDGGDAVRRTIDVAPDGYRHEFLQSGVASRLVEWESRVPDEIVPGSLQTTLKLYPSPLADLAEGMESIFRMPSGCFEQTSSTTYPNVLALTYLRKTNQNAPQIEARARQFIHVGYQRLLTFESPGGGFDWYGGGPGNASLTAYGLMEFEDMAQVYDVDPRLIERTRRWLLAQRQRDGSWQAEGRRFRGVRQAADADYVSTAYVAWSAFRNGAARREAAATADYLLRRRPEDFNSPYTLALALHGLLAVQEDGQELNPYFDRLAEIAVRGEGADAGKAWWAQESDQTTIFYGEDRSADVETTALALLALQKTNRNPQLVQDGMLWLTTQKDARGTWHSTQATILALKALLWQPPNAQSAGEPLVVNVTLEGEIVESIEIQADQIDVVQLVDLTKHRAANRARWGVSAPDGSVRYQFVSEYYDSTPEDAPQDALKVDVTYEKRQAKVGDIVQATAVIENRTNRVAPMVILDLPIPAGFEIDSSTFRDLVTEKLIDKYEMTARKVIVYIRGIEAGSRLQIPYHLRARMSARVKAPGVEAFRYYDPERRGRSAAVELNVTET